MQIEKYLNMNKAEIQEAIDKTNGKIKSLKKEIQLLERLQQSAKGNPQETPKGNPQNPMNF